MRSHLYGLIFVLGLGACAWSGGSAQESTRDLASTSSRQQIPISVLADTLDKQGKLEPLFALAEHRIQEMIPDPVLRAPLLAQLEVIRRQKDWKKFDHFPVIPISQIKTLRPALGGLGGDREFVQSEKFSGRLETYLGRSCSEKASLPAPVHPSMPELSNGHFPNAQMSACEVDHSLKLVRILNSLMRADSSEIRVGEHRARSVQKLFEALVSTGHQIEMHNERTYANFLSLNARENPVIWPVWIDTGLKTQEGEALTIPVGHSHHAWRIRGPLVTARVMFYLGVSGVGFFAQVDERPAWTGMRSAYSVNSDSAEGLEAILKAADTAGRYFRRIQREAALYAQNMPADGYGYLGVCNDSNAVLEAATRVDPRTGQMSISTYPLARAAELDSKPVMRDGLDALMRSLPKDTERGLNRQDVLRRILSMTPFESLDDPRLHDAGLRRRLKSVQRQLQ
jgi:ribosomal protein L17